MNHWKDFSFIDTHFIHSVAKNTWSNRESKSPLVLSASKEVGNLKVIQSRNNSGYA